MTINWTTVLVDLPFLLGLYGLGRFHGWVVYRRRIAAQAAHVERVDRQRARGTLRPYDHRPQQVTVVPPPPEGPS